jgi:hypothetical protein
MLSTGDSLVVITLAGVGALIAAVWLFRFAELYDRIGKGGIDIGATSADPDIPSELSEIQQMREAIAALRQKRREPRPNASTTMSTIDHELNLLLAATAPEIAIHAIERSNPGNDTGDHPENPGPLIAQ